jgi:hypothetical protein
MYAVLGGPEEKNREQIAMKSAPGRQRRSAVDPNAAEWRPTWGDWREEL